MRFQVMRDCRRSAPEQRYICAAMEIFPRLPEGQRKAVRALIGQIAETPQEGRALFEMLTKGATPQAVWDRIGVPVSRLYQMRRAFYERFPF